MKAGRPAGFSPKKLAQLPFIKRILYMIYGDPVLTRGAALVNDIRAAAWTAGGPDPAEAITAQKRLNGLCRELIAPMVHKKEGVSLWRDVNGPEKRREARALFQEIIEYLDAEEQVWAKGYDMKAEAYFLANYYIHICQGDRDIVENDRGYVTVAEALKRAPHTPSVSQVRNFLEEAIGDDAPNETTVRRMVKDLGLLPPSR